MLRLTPLREELLRGDLRSLYIGWLAGVAMGMDEDELEPSMPDGLAPFTAAQLALAEFELDVDLLAGVGMDRPLTLPGTGKEIAHWSNALTPGEMRPAMQKLLLGKGLDAERETKNRFDAGRKKTGNTPPPTLSRRERESLWGLAEGHKSTPRCRGGN